MNWGRDVAELQVADLRNVVAGDPDPTGTGTLAIQRGIEVGHVFFLGDTYSKKLQATYLDKEGKPQLIQMGCYGIGISRIAAAAIEQNHDDKGMIWPRAIAPFEVVICALNWAKSEAVQTASMQLYEQLKAQGIDVILDDRDVRPGVMFADWELIGVPVRVTVGDRGLKENMLEIQQRARGENEKIQTSEALSYITQALAQQ